MKACYFKLILQSFFFVYFNTIFFGKRVEQLFQYLIFDMLNLRIKIAAKKDVCGGGDNFNRVFANVYYAVMCLTILICKMHTYYNAIRQSFKVHI